LPLAACWFACSRCLSRELHAAAGRDRDLLRVTDRARHFVGIAAGAKDILIEERGPAIAARIARIAMTVTSSTSV